MLSYLILSLFLISPSSKEDHAIYISVLELDKSQMKVKVFIDNLEDALRNDSNSIEDYFQKKIKLQINSQNLYFSLNEVKEEGDSYWISFNMTTPENWRTFYLKADYLMELFPNQTNVVKVMIDKPQFFRLTKSNPTCSFKL